MENKAKDETIVTIAEYKMLITHNATALKLYAFRETHTDNRYSF